MSFNSFVVVNLNAFNCFVVISGSLVQILGGLGNDFRVVSNGFLQLRNCVISGRNLSSEAGQGIVAESLVCSVLSVVLFLVIFELSDNFVQNQKNLIHGAFSVHVQMNQR